MVTIRTSCGRAAAAAALLLGVAVLPGPAFAQQVKLGGLSVGTGGVSLGGTNLVSLGSGSGGISLGSGTGGISLGSGTGGISLGGGDLGLSGISLGSGTGGVSANVGDLASAAVDPSSPSGQISIGVPSFSGDNFLSGAANFSGQGGVPGTASASAELGVPTNGLLGGALDGLSSARIGISTGGSGGGGNGGGAGSDGGGPGAIGASGGGGGGGVAIGGFSASYSDGEQRLSCARVLKAPSLFAAKVVRACRLARERQHHAARRSAAR
jgi:hypothetical protein